MGADTDAAAEAAGVYGADVVYAITSPALKEYRLSAYAAGLEKGDAGVRRHASLLTSATTRGRELSAYHRLRAGRGPGARRRRPARRGRQAGGRPFDLLQQPAHRHRLRERHPGGQRTAAFLCPAGTGRRIGGC